MTTLFEDLMTGLDEVDAFLAGKKAGYNVIHPGCTSAKPEGETTDPSATHSGSTASRDRRDDKG
jgi:hypothetical protein